MPEIDGFAFCLELRRDPRFAAVPVVLTSSAYVEAADQELARAVGADALVLRSPDFAAAIEALRHSLAVTERAPAQRGAVAAARHPGDGTVGDPRAVAGARRSARRAAGAERRSRPLPRRGRALHRADVPLPRGDRVGGGGPLRPAVEQPRRRRALLRRARSGAVGDRQGRAAGAVFSRPARQPPGAGPAPG